MPGCVAGGVDLDPAVSTPHTISVEQLCCIASQDYRGNHPRPSTNGKSGFRKNAVFAVSAVTEPRGAVGQTARAQ